MAEDSGILSMTESRKGRMNKAKWQSHISEGQERRKTEGKQQRIAFIFEAQKNLCGVCVSFSSFKSLNC